MCFEKHVFFLVNYDKCYGFSEHPITEHNFNSGLYTTFVNDPWGGRVCVYYQFCPVLYGLQVLLLAIFLLPFLLQVRFNGPVLIIKIVHVLKDKHHYHLCCFGVQKAF